MRDYNDEDDNKAIEILEWREKDLELLQWRNITRGNDSLEAGGHWSRMWTKGRRQSDSRMFH